MGLNPLWSWTTPRAEKLALASPVVTPIVAGLAAYAGFRTFNLRSRIDDADEWWQRVQYALDLSLSSNSDAQLIGIAMFENLTSHSESIKLRHRKSRIRDLEMMREVLESLLSQDRRDQGRVKEKYHVEADDHDFEA